MRNPLSVLRREHINPDPVLRVGIADGTAAPPSQLGRRTGGQATARGRYRVLWQEQKVDSDAVAIIVPLRHAQPPEGPAAP